MTEYITEKERLECVGTIHELPGYWSNNVPKTWFILTSLGRLDILVKSGNMSWMQV